MLNYFQGWRERGWRVIDAATYAQAWQRFGGSVATHPLVLEQLAALAEIPVRYLGWYQADELKAAYAPWLALEVTDSEDGWILMTATSTASASRPL